MTIVQTPPVALVLPNDNPADRSGAPQVDAPNEPPKVAVRLSEGDALAAIHSCRNPELAARMMARLKERAREEEARRDFVERKANTLLASLGVSGTVAIGLGVMALPRLAGTDLTESTIWLLILLVVSTVILGALAALTALRVVRVSPASLAPDGSIVQVDTIEFFSRDDQVGAVPYTYDLIQACDLFRLMRSAKERANTKASALAVAQGWFTVFILAAFASMAAFVTSAALGALLL